MAVAFLNSWRANILLTHRLDINDTQDDSKQVALMLSYYATADRAFNRNLQDLLKLKKERQKEEIGFVRQFPQMTPTPPAEPPVKTPVEPDVPPEIVDPQPGLNPFDPESEPLGGFPRRESTFEPPKKAA